MDVVLSGVAIYFSYKFANSDFAYIHILSKIDINMLSDVNNFYRFMIFLIASAISLTVLNTIYRI